MLAALIGSVVAVYYLARAVEFVVLFSSVVGGKNIAEGALENARGDKVEASTETPADLNDPEHSVIRLTRSRAWFSRTLLETESYDFRWVPKWLNDNTLVMTIGFGCATHVGEPVTNASGIHIDYHFEYHDKELDLDLVRSGLAGPARCRAAHGAGGLRR